MAVERRARAWRALTALLALAAGACARGALCPARCRCDDERLVVSCARAGLEVVPIQLNPAVRSVDLAGNRISSVHFTLAFYGQLLALDLSANRIRTLGAGNFLSQRALRRLDLSANELGALGRDALKGLRAVEVLDLSRNRLEELAASAFRELHSLQTLRLSSNRLSVLEDGMFKAAKHLHTLLLDDNQLLEVPSGALTDAVTLQHLSLSQNLLVAVNHSEVPNLPELRTLLLDKNVISEVHHSALSSLFTLDHLDLSDNNFTYVPTDSLAKLSNLTKFKFSGNVVKIVPPVAFRGLFHLRFLRLDRLELLERIDPRAFVDNINLEKVWLDDNIGVERLPTRLFHGNPKIVHISVRNNRLISLDATHFPLDQLKRLKLGGNPLQCNCSLLWLWHLTQEQQLSNGHAFNESMEGDLSDELVIDVNDIRCAGPEQLANVLLVKATESQIDCSINWVAAVSVCVTALFILIIMALVLYWSALHRMRAKEAQMGAGEAGCRSKAVPTCANGHSEMYEGVRPDKCIMPPPLVHNDYRSLPPWEAYRADCASTKNFYEQLDKNTKARPHIVYV